MTNIEIGAEQQSQGQISNSSFDKVDSIRFLKTNVSFYERAMLVWIKFKMINKERFQDIPKTQQFALL